MRPANAMNNPADINARAWGRFLPIPPTPQATAAIPARDGRNVAIEDEKEVAAGGALVRRITRPRRSAPVLIHDRTSRATSMTTIVKKEPIQARDAMR
jgi:hypothetical protein